VFNRVGFETGSSAFDSWQSWHDVVDAFQTCSHLAIDKLHPKSPEFLARWSLGLLTDDQFLTVFHLPNSDYIPVGACIINLIQSTVPL
jgi:hypothetical protein